LALGQAGWAKRLDLNGGCLAVHGASFLPRHGLALVVEVPQARLAASRCQRISYPRNALLHANTFVRSSHIRPDPSWIDQGQASSIASVSNGVRSHQGIQSRLAGAIDFPPACFVQGDATHA